MTNHPALNWRVAAGVLLGLALVLFAWPAAGPVTTFAQAPDESAAPDEDVAGPSAEPADGSTAEDGAADDEADDEAEEPDAATTGDGSGGGDEQRLSVVKLIFQGGLLMIPIGLMSLLVAMFGIERGLGLRRDRVMPQGLVDGLSQLSTSPGGFDPRKAYRLCQRFPSSAAVVIKAMLLKVGRPHSEVEHAVSEASEREAGRLYANVRWLSLAAAVAPLLGLLGTVWGMIVAFHQTTQLESGQNKADFLAEGIYVALVTTLGGLAVAIPAAILAHWFEGRIQGLFHQTDELLFNLLPQIERYEGRLRVSHQSLGGEAAVERPAVVAEEAGAAAAVSK